MVPSLTPVGAALANSVQLPRRHEVCHHWHYSARTSGGTRDSAALRAGMRAGREAAKLDQAALRAVARRRGQDSGPWRRRCSTPSGPVRPPTAQKATGTAPIRPVPRARLQKCRSAHTRGMWRISDPVMDRHVRTGHEGGAEGTRTPDPHTARLAPHRPPASADVRLRSSDGLPAIGVHRWTSADCRVAATEVAPP